MTNQAAWGLHMSRQISRETFLTLMIRNSTKYKRAPVPCVSPIFPFLPRWVFLLYLASSGLQVLEIHTLAGLSQTGGTFWVLVLFLELPSPARTFPVPQCGLRPEVDEI